MTTLTVAELCTGYAGLTIALQQVADVEPAWFSEVDKAACSTLTHHYPDVPNYGDMTRIDWKDVPAVDLIAGGTPCTNLSRAGNREGLTGGESSLWFHMLRAVETIRPRWIVWENVQGAKSAKSDLPGVSALDRVIGQLTAAGYTVEWTTLRASQVGAPHQRARVFLLATRHDADPLPITKPAPALTSVKRTTLPTPAVNDMGRGKTVQWWDDWTATMKARHGNGNGHGKSLAIEVRRPRFEETYGYALGYWSALMGRTYPKPTSAAFEEWLMGLPAGWITAIPGVTEQQAHKLAGNGVVPQQAAHALSGLASRVDLLDLPEGGTA